MLRKDSNASFKKFGIWPLTQYRFEAGALEARRPISATEHRRLMRRQLDEPVEVLYDEERRRRWWMFEDEVFTDDDDLDAAEVKALALARKHLRQRRLQRATALLEHDAVQEPSRSAIPDEVKLFVWQRDGGRCVRCQGKERLEFDHVIPIAVGGGNTARNLQLLCEACNREKGASLV